MWFESWYGVFRVVAVGIAAYACLVLLLRISGKRSLTKLNAFDLVVTIAMGSTLSSLLISKDVPFTEGLTALVVLIGAQYLVSSLSVRSPGFAKLVRSQPRVLVLHGEFLDDALDSERITRDEVMSAVRGKGLPSVREVGAVVLESDGSMHVIPADAVKGTRDFESLPRRTARGGDTQQQPAH